MMSLAAGLIAVSLAAAQPEPRTVTPKAPPSTSTLAGYDAASMIVDWPKVSQDAAKAMISRYGQPDVIGNTLLEWKDRAPFTKITVTREAVPHDFPVAHPDVLTQEIELAVPIDKLAELARFDGSIVVDRTKGTVSSRSDTESNNLLALNLADDIIAGQRDAASARRFFAETLEKKMAGKSSEYTQKLIFSVSGKTANPDHPLRLPAPGRGAP